MTFGNLFDRLRDSTPSFLNEIRERTRGLLPSGKGAARKAPAESLGKAFGVDLGDGERVAEPRPPAPLAEDAPRAAAAPEPPPAEVTDEEFEDLLDALGATPPEPDVRDEIARRDATIAELQGMLGQLRGLGDELARTERARHELEGRVRHLETTLEARMLEFERALAEARAGQARAQAEAHAAAVAAQDAREARPGAEAGGALPPDVEKLMRAAERREGVLARERERHAATRAKLADKKQIAAERWREIVTLRAEVKRLERALLERTPLEQLAAPLAVPGAEAPRAPLTALMRLDPAAADEARQRATVRPE